MSLNDGLEEFHENFEIHFYYNPGRYRFVVYRMHAASNKVLEDGRRDE